MGIDEARAKFERWKECRALLDQQTSALQTQMRQYMAGTQPMPSDLLDEVLLLQKRCIALFEDVVKAMNTP
jgi:hypothetical protein